MNNKNLRFIPFLVVTFIVTVETAISFNSTLLPNIKADFSISDQAAQFSITATLIALGFSGFLYGGLSDCIGRRAVFIFSTLLFSIGTLLSANTDNLILFYLARILQGFGSGAGWVVGNACLKDIFDGKAYVKVMNNTHAVAGIVPAVAPVLGSYLAASASWQDCFYLVFFLSLISVVGMFFFQAETLAQRSKFDLQKTFKDYKSLCSNPHFLKYLSVKVLMVMLLFCEISTLPLVFVDYMNVKAQYYGFYLLPPFVFYVLATILSNKLIALRPIDDLLKLGLFLILLSNVSMISLYNLDLTPIQTMLIRSLNYVGWGFLFGNATSQIVSAVPGKAGMASALMIALEMFFSGLGISFIGMFFNGTLIPLSLFMVLSAAFGLTIMSYSSSGIVRT